VSKTVLSLFDYTGNWAKPWIKYGYNVVTVDIKPITSEYRYQGRWHICQDIMDLIPHQQLFGYNFDVILCAVPCTHFALSGAKHFAAKDADGRTAEGIKLVEETLKIIKLYQPRVWAIENPMSRIHKLVPELGSPKLKFDPWEYAGWTDGSENRNKRTWLWGEFNIPERKPVAPEARNDQGHSAWINKVGGKSEKTKEYRSMTPMGFAEAFAAANQ
jgi:hypothetical protein